MRARINIWDRAMGHRYLKTTRNRRSSAARTCFLMLQHKVD
jgi:hypothetical protein